MMRRIIYVAALAGSLVLLPASAVAQQCGTSCLTVERIFGPDAIRAEGAGEVRWTPNGDGYFALEQAAVGKGRDVVRYDLPGGARHLLVSARDLVPQGAQTPLTIDDYSWSPDGRKLLIRTDSKRFRRTKALGDYWLFDLDTKSLRKLGGDAAPSTLLYADFSPDGRQIAYVRENNLNVQSVDGDPPRQLTHDGNDLIVNGVGDWVNQEEFGIAKAFRWSPDSRRIAFWQFDTSGIATFAMIKNTGGQYPQVIDLQYPKAGSTNAAVRVGAVSIEDGRATWFALAGDPRQNYVPQMDWAANGDAVLIQHANRLQNRYDVLLGDPASGKTTALFTERDKAWVEANPTPSWLDQGKAFTWLSERDGWRHLYVVSRDGRRVSLRTPGAFDVMSLEAIDTANGWAYFIASPDNPTQRYLYRAPLTGAPKVERVTPAGDSGWNRYDIAPGAHWAIHTVSTADQPPTTTLIDMAAQRSIRTLADNAPLRALLAANPIPKTQFLKLDIGGGVMLDASLMKPPGFDPAKKYPILFYVYGEPAGVTVTDNWGGNRALWHRMLAERGYLIASIDPRGTPQPRGRAWRKSIYGQVGILASADFAAGVRKLVSERPYIDPTRIGIWGWSGGGAMTQNAMFRYPDLYSTGIAVAGPTNQLLYDTIYQERYMGLPQDNPTGYHDGSPINFAQNLRGNLLLIHGTGDDNVHYQNMEQLIDRLIGADRQFSMMAYPDRTHGISEGRNTSVHLYTLMTRYLDEHLMRGEHQ